jgi:tetratricopeptide (TPR) repeat protein
MKRERRSLQDRIRERQQSGFVGRRGQVIQYQENMRFPVEDGRRRFLFNIHGDAGVGKTFLARQLRQIAVGDAALTAYVDETSEDVISAMTAMAAEFSRADSKLAAFEKRVGEYRQRRHELESDPHAPVGVAAFLTKTAVTIGLAAARDMPVAGSLLAPLDTVAAAEQANLVREYLTRKFSDHRDVSLILSPAEELTPVFVRGLNDAAAGRTVALFFDTYERTGAVLDRWLRNLYAGRYGDLPETLITTISGQKPLDSNLWSDYLPVIADIQLEEFSEAEARQFLTSKDITDEPTVQVILRLSERLPLWVATLADARLQGGGEVGDPSGDAVDRFLKWEGDPARREIAMAAALPRVINRDVLAVISSADEIRVLFGWLRSLPFLTRRGQSWAYHDVVRSAMLRLRRAETPAEWRAEHNLLAQANGHWAAGAAKSAESSWSDVGWVDYTREENYHLLCADPHGNLPKVLASAVRAAERGPARALQWATLIADAGRDTDNHVLREWGERLTGCIRRDDLAPYLTFLINSSVLDAKHLIVAYGERGESYRLVGRYDDALADFSRAIELDPESSWSFTRRGDTYRGMKRYDDALADYSRAIELDPIARAFADRKDSHEDRRRHDEDALAHMGFETASDQESTRTITCLGGTYRDIKKYDDSLADFSRVNELDPTARVFADRGDAFRHLGRYDDALADLARAIELDPESAWVISYRGRSYHDMKRYEDSLADFSRVIALDPTVRALIDRADVYRHLLRYEDSLADLNRTLEITPNSFDAIAYRGDTYHDMKRYEDSLADFSRAIQLNPEDVQSFVDRGDVHAHLEHYEEACIDLSRAVELDPKDASAISQRGEIYLLMGRNEDALADFNKATELDPGDNYYAARGAEVCQLMSDNEDR